MNFQPLFLTLAPFSDSGSCLGQSFFRVAPRHASAPGPREGTQRIALTKVYRESRMTFAPSCRFLSNISFLHPRPFVLNQRPTNSSFQVLVMDGNHLRQLRGANFASSNLRHLTDLSLTNCRLSSLSETTFADLTRLVTINLSNNNLTSISATVRNLRSCSFQILHPSIISDVQLMRPLGAVDPEREQAEFSRRLLLPRPHLPRQA